MVVVYCPSTQYFCTEPTTYQFRTRPLPLSHLIPQTTLLIEWENVEITKDPVKIIAADDPVTCAIYARENGLLDQPGWKRFKHIAKNEKKFTGTVNQAKLKSFHTAPKYKYGSEIPRTYEQAK
jgi:hypothetical protein